MSRLLLFTALAVTAFSSCSVYRSGQTKTPDDVYYSPAREGAAYVETEKKQRDGYYRADDNSYDDRWLRMRVRDRYRWSAFDDYDWNDYRYSNWAFNSYSYSPYYFNSYWNNMYAWNNYYNPYCGGIIIVNPKVNQPAYTAVRNFSLSRYSNTNYNNTNRPLSASKTGTRYSSPGYNNSNTRTNSSLGNSVRKVFSNGNSSGRDSYYSPGSSSDRPSRTYTPDNSSSSRSYTPPPSSSGSSSSGSSSSGSSSGGGVSRPSRGGN